MGRERSASSGDFLRSAATRADEWRWYRDPRTSVPKPFGKPKTIGQAARNERTIENMVSRLAGIKGGDAQIPSGAISVLWLDFQDDSWGGYAMSSHLRPVTSWNGTLSSGGFWHAFYGRKGMPLVEGGDVCLGLLGNVVEMQHHGRFYDRTDADEPKHRAAGVIVSLPEHCALFQNPVAKRQLPPSWIVSALQFPWFRLEDSWLDWPTPTLKERLSMTEAMLSDLRGSVRHVIEADS